MKKLNYENFLYNKKRRIAGLLFLLALAIPLNSEDDFFDEDFTESENDNFEDDYFGSSSEPSLQFNGFASIGIRYWLHKDLQRVDTYPVFGLNLKHESSKTELETMLRLNANSITEYPLDAINEFTLRAFLGDFVLSAGKMKIVWGKGDMIHVLDSFNANDFTDFTIPTYIDRRIAEPMLHLAYNPTIPLSLEVAWTPMMTPDRIALDGPWVPAQIENMKKKAKSMLGSKTAFPTEKVQALINNSITNTLKSISSSTGEIKTNFPKLTDEEIEEIVTESEATFTATKNAIRATLKKMGGKEINIDASSVLTPEKIEAIAKKESAKYTQLLNVEFNKKVNSAMKKIEAFSLDPFIKMGMNSFLPDMHNVKYGQCGLRLTGTVKSVDMGAQYYFGHYKTPSIDAAKMAAASLDNLSDLSSAVHYDPVHIFGVDLGAVIAMFNIKTELAYYMTYDFEGTDPSVHNNSLQWVAGFDVNIPLNNLNLNIQNLASWTLGFKKIKDNNTAGKADMDWNTAEKSTNNKLIVNISDNWLHGKLTDSLTVIWGIEHNDLVVMPSIKYKVKDELYVEGKGAYIYAKNKKSEFSNWQNNHFAQIGMEYKF